MHIKKKLIKNYKHMITQQNARSIDLKKRHETHAAVAQQQPGEKSSLTPLQKGSQFQSFKSAKRSEDVP